MEEYTLDIVKEGRQTYVVLPFDARKQYNQPKGTLYVQATLNGVPHRSKLVSLGEGRQALFLNAALRKTLGLGSASAQLTASFAGGAHTFGPLTTPEGLVEASASGDGLSLLAGLTTRTSCRSYTGEKVDAKHIATILNAGFCAPSAHNKRPWQFVVVESRPTLDKIAAVGTYTKMLAGAPLGIVVCADTMLQGMEEWWLVDCAAAIQNMLLCAHGLALGAVWCGVGKGSALRKSITALCTLPGGIVPMAVLAIGHPKETKQPTPRFEEGKVHYEKW